LPIPGEEVEMRKILSTVVAAALVSSLLVAVTSGSGAAASDRDNNHHKRVGADVAALHDIQSRFHESVSGGGNIVELMSLWADDATFTAGGTTNRGKDEIRAFFLKSGGFTHNWVSVSPTFKTRISVDGKTADIYFECHFVAWQANPQVVVTHGTFEGTARKVRGHWLFWHITAGVNPLTP
jgi:hypothetical protein